MQKVGVIGRINSGRITLTEWLVAEVCGRGCRVFTIKHAQHNVDVDQRLEINDIATNADFILTQTGLEK